jgi:hypothetical protein
VIWHEAIGPDTRACLFFRFCRECDVGGVIIIAEEAVLATVAALRDVMREMRHDNPGEPGRASVLVCNGVGAFSV